MGKATTLMGSLGSCPLLVLWGLRVLSPSPVTRAAHFQVVHTLTGTLCATCCGMRISASVGDMQPHTPHRTSPVGKQDAYEAKHPALVSTTVAAEARRTRRKALRLNITLHLTCNVLPHAQHC